MPYEVILFPMLFVIGQVCTTLTSITTRDILETNADTVYHGLTQTEEEVKAHILKVFFGRLQEKTWTNKERAMFLKELKAHM